MASPRGAGIDGDGVLGIGVGFDGVHPRLLVNGHSPAVFLDHELHVVVGFGRQFWANYPVRGIRGADDTAVSPRPDSPAQREFRGDGASRSPRTVLARYYRKGHPPVPRRDSTTFGPRSTKVIESPSAAVARSTDCGSEVFPCNGIWSQWRPHPRSPPNAGKIAAHQHRSPFSHCGRK